MYIPNFIYFRMVVNLISAHEADRGLGACRGLKKTASNSVVRSQIPNTNRKTPSIEFITSTPVPLSRALRPLKDGVWDVFKGRCGVLVHGIMLRHPVGRCDE